MAENSTKEVKRCENANESVVPEELSPNHASNRDKTEKKSSKSSKNQKHRPPSHQNSTESSERNGSSRSVSPPLPAAGVRSKDVEETNKSGSSKLETQRRKREEKCRVTMLAQIENLPEAERMQHLLQKYSELAEENRVMSKTLQQTQQVYSKAVHDRDRFETEATKHALQRAKLEELCRELQRQNRTVKEESLSRLKEQEEKRKEICHQFQNAIDEMNKQMKSGQDRSSALFEENAQMANKINAMFGQFKAKDEYMEKVVQAKELEIQLVKAKLEASEVSSVQEMERSLVEKEQLLKALKEKCEAIEMLKQSEDELKEQLKSYGSKYQQFQESLRDSNSMFDNFKAEMQQMTKRLMELEKESREWKSKWEHSQVALVEASTKYAELGQQAQRLVARNEALEKLCRTLQEERRKVISPEVNGDSSTPADNKHVENDVNGNDNNRNTRDSMVAIENKQDSS